MHKTTWVVSIAAGVLAASNIGTVQAQQGAQQGNAATGNQGRVLSATPIHSEAMVALERAAQRLRESIQSLAQKPAGSQRDQALSDARRALYDTQQSMMRLPPEYRVSGVVVSNAPIRHANPAQNRSFDDSMKELRLTADRLRDSIQAMAQQPAGPRRNDAIREAHEALRETQQVMAWVPGYPAASATANAAGSAGQGRISSQAGSGIAAGSDASALQGQVPATAGGVGLNARAMLSNEARPDHNVKMVFSLNTGNYLADVDVQVKDAKGRTVIDGVSDGPWLYAKLPPGSYTATATYNGHTVTERFTVGRSTGQRVTHFRWPASVEQMVSGVSPILGTGPQVMR